MNLAANIILITGWVGLAIGLGQSVRDFLHGEHTIIPAVIYAVSGLIGAVAASLYFLDGDPTLNGVGFLGTAAFMSFMSMVKPRARTAGAK